LQMSPRPVPRRRAATRTRPASWRRRDTADGFRGQLDRVAGAVSGRAAR
jgi:hypothetical protein